MKKVINILILIMLALVVSAQTNKDACQWMKKGEWRNGFNRRVLFSVSEEYKTMEHTIPMASRYRFREYTKGQATHSQFNPDSQCGGL